MLMRKDEHLFVIKLNPDASSSTLLLRFYLSNICKFYLPDNLFITSAQLYQVLTGNNSILPIIKVLIYSY